MGASIQLRPASIFALAVAIAVQPSPAFSQGQDLRDPPQNAPTATKAEPGSMAPPQASETSQDVTETIVVTGSRIPRPNLTAVSPVTLVDQQDVQIEGATLVEELLNRLPQVRPSQGVFVSNGATGTAEVDLRGIGAERTLVLINGRRVMPGDTTVPDINSVPTSLIQRVEVLTGGAAAVYGSDAIAGVVNMILDTELEGLRVDGQISVFQHDNRLGASYRDLLTARGIPFPRGSVVDGGRQSVDVAFGSGFLDDRGHVTVYGGYRHISAVTQDRRDYSSCAFGVVNPQFRQDVIRCDGSSAAFPGNFFTNFDAFQIGPDRTFTPGFVPYNYGPLNYFQRPGRRYTAGGFAEFEISKAIQPYMEVMYMDDRSVAQIAPSANFFNTQTINCDSPLLSDQQRSLVCFTGNFVGEVPVFDDDTGELVDIIGSPDEYVDPVTGTTYNRGWLFVGRRNIEGGPRQADLRHKNLRLVGGIKGDLGRGATYDASYIWGRVVADSTYLNGLSVTRLQRSLDVVADPVNGQPVCRSALTGEDAECVPWDIFVLGGVTADASNYLDVLASRHTVIKQQVANANTTLDLGRWGMQSPWAEDAPAINFGAEYRKDRLDFEPDEHAESGDLAGTGAIFPVKGSVTVKELFAELQLPLVTNRLVDKVTVEAGYRQSWYQNPESSFSTNAYKLALDLSVTRGVRFRASYQRAVRAPNIVELFTPLDFYEFPRDPCAGTSPQATLEQCALTGVTAAQYGHIIGVPNPDIAGYHGRSGGNPELEPEKATTRSVGLVLEPRLLRGLNATLDWWDIDLQGAISQIGSTRILGTCLESGDPLFCDRVHRDPNGSLWLSPDGYVDDRLANIGGLNIRGVDVGLGYVTNLGSLGSGSLYFLGSRLLKYVNDPGGLASTSSCAGLYGFPCGTPLPRWRHTARISWDLSSQFSISTAWRYISSVKLASVKLRPELPFYPGDTKIGDRSYFDLSGLFRAERDLVLRFGINNILDKAPPIVGGTANTTAGDGTNGNTFPQLYDPLGRYMFVGFTANL